MIRNFISFFIACFFGMISHAQVGVGTTTPQAALDVSSTTKGILIPRMTTAQRNAISSPQVSTLVFDTDLGDFYTYTSTGWLALVPKPSSKINQVFSKSSLQYFATGTDITWDQRAGQGTALSYSGASVTLPANKIFMIIIMYAHYLIKNLNLKFSICSLINLLLLSVYFLIFLYFKF